jgi:hypothetical protein
MQVSFTFVEDHHIICITNKAMSPGFEFLIEFIK